MNEPTPQNTEKLNHSGNLSGDLQETPVNEYSTPLEDAVNLTDAAGNPVITTPETAESITESPFGNELETEKKSKKPLIIGGVAVAATALIALGSVFGIKNATETNNEAPQGKPVAEAPVDPTVAPSAEAPSVEPSKAPGADPEYDPATTLPESVVEMNLFGTLSAEQQAEIKSMDAMSVEEFRTLPIPEQLKFGYFVYDNNLDAMKYRLDQNDGTQLYESANIDTPEGRVATQDVKVALLSSLKTDSEVEGTAYDIDTALKASVILNQENTYNAVQGFDTFLNGFNLNSPVYNRPIDITDSAVRDNGDLVVNLSNPASGVLSQDTYKYAEVTLINGEVRKDSILALSISDTDPRYIKDIHK
jgi:hypothetical protein